MNDQQLQRQQRGYDIFNRFKITKQEQFYFVPSASQKGKYKVDLFNQTCNCHDFEIRKVKCKHLYAAEFHVDRDFLDAIDNIPAVVKETPKKKSYAQPNWKAYNNSQVSEKIQLQYLLHELCQGIDNPQPKETGRKPYNFSDLIFSMAYKVYSCFSSRRFMGDLHEAFGKEYLTKLPHYNTIINAFGMEELTPCLKQLIEQSSLPLVSIERDFAVDSSGLSTSQGFTWLHAKFSEPHLIEKKNWLKVHLICGVQTNVVTAVEITDRYAADSNYFETLVDQTAENFKIYEVSADKAYLGSKNFEAVTKHLGMPYIPFKTTSTGNSKTNRQSNLWKWMYHYYSLNQDKFFEHYHKRSNVETTFSMIKAKFGGALRSRTKTAQTNEALCKVLCHNLCVLITSMHELGLKPKFWSELH